MKFALNIAPFGPLADVRALTELAQQAEESGWDGLFLWDHIHWTPPEHPESLDPWMALAVIASQTSRLKLGTMVTPLARRRPTTLARQTVTLERLAPGRLILGVGVGAPSREEFEQLGEQADLKTRARQLDEHLDVLTRLWSGEPVNHQGEFYSLENVRFLPRAERIPIWVGAAWPGKPGPLQRARRWHGYFPVHDTLRPLTPEELEQAVAALNAPIDVMVGGARYDRAYERAGATWWSQVVMPGPQAWKRVQAGPP